MKQIESCQRKEDWQHIRLAASKNGAYFRCFGQNSEPMSEFWPKHLKCALFKGVLPISRERAYYIYFTLAFFSRVQSLRCKMAGLSPQNIFEAS